MNSGDNNFDQGQLSYPGDASKSSYRFMNYDQNVSTSIEQFYQQLLQQKNQGKNVMGETNMLSDKYCVKNNSKELKVDMANTEMTQKNMQSGYVRKIFRN